MIEMLQEFIQLWHDHKDDGKESFDLIPAATERS